MPAPRPAPPRTVEGNVATLRTSVATLTHDLAAAREELVAARDELTVTRRELWTERARLAHPALTDVAFELVNATDEGGFADQAEKLAELTRSRAQPILQASPSAAHSPAAEAG